MKSMESYSKEEFEAAPETPPLTEKEQEALSAVEKYKDKVYEMVEKEPESTQEAIKNILKTLFSRESMKVAWHGNLADKVIEKTRGTKIDFLNRAEGEASRINKQYDLLVSRIKEAKQEKTTAEQKLEDALNNFENFKKENDLAE